MRSIKNVYEHLFEQLDRLSSASGDELKQEINKSHAMISVSQQILATAETEANIIAAVQNLGTGFVSTHEVEELPASAKKGELEYNHEEEKEDTEEVESEIFNPDKEQNWLINDGNDAQKEYQKQSQSKKKNQNRL